jgi:short-subunit dehydrogenase
MELRGKTVLLTGATGGLGRAIATALADRGASLVLSSRKGEELEQLASELPGEHRVAVADLAEPGAALKLLADAGEIDVLVANAGMPGAGRLEDFTSDGVQRALRVNLEGPMLMTHALLPRMIERDSGHIVMVGSLSGVAPTARQSIYNATKFGLRGFTLALREDLRETGASASLVAPGFVRDAGMFADAGVAAPAGMGTTSPQHVSAAVVEAIEKDRGEITVAPFRQARLAKFAGNHPEFAGRVSGKAAAKAGDEVARGHNEAGKQ